jgi:hypothetical protein
MPFTEVGEQDIDGPEVMTTIIDGPLHLHIIGFHRAFNKAHSSRFIDSLGVAIFIAKALESSNTEKFISVIKEVEM